MYLSNLKLWNFRLFGSNQEVSLETGELRPPDLDLDFKNGLNVLIGENDTGKTAVIDAIKLVTNTHSSEWVRIAPEDFHHDRNSLRIECRFDGLRDAEAKNFTEWLCMDGEGDDSRPYLRAFCQVGLSEDKVPYYDTRAGADSEGQVLSQEAREYLKAIYLKPLRDAESELAPRRNSRLSQILSGHDFFKPKNDAHTLVNLSNCFNCLAQKYFDSSHRREDCEFEDCPLSPRFKLDTASEGKALRDTLDQTIQNFSGRDRLSAYFGFGQTDPKIRHILEQLRLTLSDEQLGLGSHNLLFIATELLNLERENWSGLRLGLVEEIEAHLHPQAQMRVIEYLRRFIQENQKEDVQLILTTHSPNIGSKVPLDNLILCCDCWAFPLGTNSAGESYTKLRKADHSFLERFLDTTKANLFFARGVILVEGWAEEIMLPALAKKLGIDLTKKGISIINVGNTAFLRYARIFQRQASPPMTLPVAIITDLDARPDSGIDLEAKKAEKKQKYRGNPVEAFVSPYWTLEYCIALSPRLAPYLFEAVKRAGEEQHADGQRIGRITETYEELATGKTQEAIAWAIYNSYIIERKISKAVLAQHFSKCIEACIPKDAIENAPEIQYLVDAIQYVTH